MSHFTKNVFNDRGEKNTVYDYHKFYIFQIVGKHGPVYEAYYRQVTITLVILGHKVITSEN